MKVHSMRRIRGQGMSEYIIITALIAVAAIGVFAMFGDTLQKQTSGLAQEMAGQDGSDQIDDAGDSADDAVTNSSNNDSLSSYSDGNNN